MKTPSTKSPQAQAETKHTPGPWTRDERDARVWSPAGKLIALALGAGVFSDEEILANGDLIAAAPELYELAKGYEQWEADLLLCDAVWNHPMDSLPTITQELWDKLLALQTKRNAAIAKAKGVEL